MFYSRPPKTSHLPVVSYCFLCRRNLVPIYGGSSIRPQSWEVNLVAIPEPPPKRRVLRVTLEPHTRGTHDRLILDGDKVKVCDVPAKACEPCHKGGSVYVAHRDCWSLAVGAGRTSIGLYRFAANLQHVIPPRYSAQPPLCASFYPHVLTTTELGRLVHTAAMCLPAEIQHIIIEYLGDHLVSSLCRASQTMASHVQETPLYRAVTHVTPVAPQRVDSLCIKTTSIFGLAYLSEVAFNEREGDFIDVKDTGFIGVRFALGTYGIRGLRVLYEDGSMSRWLGDPRFSWFGEVYGTELRNLTVVRDELRILKVVFEKGYCMLGPGSMATGLWSHEVALRRDLVHSVAAPDYERGHPVFYEDWNLHGYLQLGGDDWYASGITVYLQENRISGILSHSEHPSMIGVSDGYAVYFSLRHDERITGLWVMTHVPEEQGAVYQPPITAPSILVVTNLARAKYFGHHGMKAPHPCQWTPLIRRGAIAMGFYFDGSGSVCVTALPCGVPSRFNKLRRTVRQRPPESHRQGNGVSLVTWAMLTAVRSLKVCMDGEVYAGLLIEYDDGITQALGSWDASGKSPIRTIYELGDGPLMRLAFRLGEREGVRRVVEITPVVGDASIPEGDVTICVLNIVWWFGTAGDYVSNREWITRDMPTDALPIPVHRASPGSEAWLMGNPDV